MTATRTGAALGAKSWKSWSAHIGADVAIFRLGRGAFLLQSRYHKDWAENAMMQLMVDDLDHWWPHIRALDVPG